MTRYGFLREIAYQIMLHILTTSFLRRQYIHERCI